MFQFDPVTIDLAAVANCLSRLLGRAVSDVEAIVHLRNEGLIPYGEGWLANPTSMTSLQGLLQSVNPN